MNTDTAIQHFNQSLAVALNSGEVFKALHLLTNTLVGTKHITIMHVDMDAMLAVRSYTSDAENYPTSGTKSVEMNRWFEVVHGNNEKTQGVLT